MAARKKSGKLRKISGKDVSILSVLAQHITLPAGRKKKAVDELSREGKAIAKHLLRKTSSRSSNSLDEKAASELKAWAASNRS